MHIDIQGHDLKGQVSTTTRLNRSPDSCPLCHRAVQPRLLSAQHDASRRRIQVAFRCTSHACQEVFVATYTEGASGFDFHSSAPVRAQPPSLPQTVSSLSPAFVEILAQVSVAESQGLGQLVGIGLRKALEFLIKDFVSSERPVEAEKIKRMPLAACISTYVNDPWT
ncbi:MAG TPA: hypothetical protein VHC20_01540 [Candidatus Paceibacterota bacterium]|nr:hypothetical protein [Candidatus Paceibacterota bacterium]